MDRVTKKERGRKGWAFASLGSGIATHYLIALLIICYRTCIHMFSQRVEVWTGFKGVWGGGGPHIFH